MRYEPSTRPNEVNGPQRSGLRLGLQQLGASFGFAYRLPGRWGVLRGAYGLNYGQIFPVTYQQDRLNPPGNLQIVVPAPDLADPLAASISRTSTRTAAPASSRSAPISSTPYSHQYNFSWEFEFARDWSLQLGYVGSRSHKLMLTYYLNRGAARGGHPAYQRDGQRPARRPVAVSRTCSRTTARSATTTPARVSLIVPRWRGLTLARLVLVQQGDRPGQQLHQHGFGPRLALSRSQTEFDRSRTCSGLSNFDQPHAFLVEASYETPRVREPAAGCNASSAIGTFRASGC